MDLNKDQQSFYTQARERCRQDVAAINQTLRTEWAHLNEEIRRVNELIQTLEARKQTIGQMYASASDILGADNDLDISPAIKDGDDSADDLGVGEIDL